MPHNRDMPDTDIPYSSAARADDAPQHWIVAQAAPPAHWGKAHWPDLRHFRPWKRCLTQQKWTDSRAQSDSSHEHAAKQHLGLPDASPWPAAAVLHWQTQGVLSEHALLQVTPCHWQLGMDSAQMLPLAQLSVSAAEQQALGQSLLPFFEEDGLHLVAQTPGHWLMRLPLDWLPLALPSLDAALHGRVQDHLPRGTGHPTLKRLQAEAQMLLYHHPVNEAREAQRQPTINALWFSGAGLLSEGQTLMLGRLRLDTRLSEAAQNDDPTRWQAAWQSLDADLAAWAQSDASRHGGTLSLCGAEGFLQWRVEKAAWGPAHWWRQRRTATLQALLAPLQPDTTA